MSTLIKSQSELQKILKAKAQEAIRLSQIEICNVIQKHIDNYYTEYSPKFYERTYRFRDGLIMTDISIKGNSVSCSVGFDNDYLKYEYPGNSSWGGNEPATGADIVEWANEGLHGGMKIPGGGEPFWDNAMEELGRREGIMEIIKKNFKKVGLPLTK